MLLYFLISIVDSLGRARYERIRRGEADKQTKQD
jgi:hypothetical protein